MLVSALYGIKYMYIFIIECELYMKYSCTYTHKIWMSNIIYSVYTATCDVKSQEIACVNFFCEFFNFYKKYFLLNTIHVLIMYK